MRPTPSDLLRTETERLEMFRAIDPDHRKGQSPSLPPLAWPGGYPILYYTADGAILCSDCATEILSDPESWGPESKPTAFDVFYEGESITCDHCGLEIESAYGDPDSED